MLASALVEAAAKKAQSAVAALKHKAALPHRFKRDGTNAAADIHNHHILPKTIMKGLHPDHEKIMKEYARKAAASDSETSKDLQQRLEDHRNNLRGTFTHVVDKIHNVVQEVEHAVMNKASFPYFGTPVSEIHDFSTYKPLGPDRFAEWKDGSTPYEITDEIRKQSDDLARTRRVHVKNAMKHAWKGYKEHAFGQDEVLPISGRGHNNWGGMGTTLVDSLDTLWLMGLTEEFWEGRDWVRDHLDHDHVGSVSVFETTIRSLGGLLSAYDWSGDKVFLEKAKDLGKRLFRAFESPSGIPYGQVSLSHPETHSNLGWTGGNAILSEAGTLQVEFRYLARVTNVTEYATTSERVFEIMEPLQSKNNGLFPYYVKNNNKEVKFGNAKITFGAMGDSIYEYMLKIWLQGGKTESLYRTMYDNAMQGMHEMLLQYSEPTKLAYIADQNSGNLNHKMDHLVCFMGGSLVLGAYTDPLGLDSERAQRDLKVGKASFLLFSRNNYFECMCLCLNLCF
jgi:mannosyl-oligosaccharide alpha-1,2-mannosidase